MYTYTYDIHAYHKRIYIVIYIYTLDCNRSTGDAGLATCCDTTHGRSIACPFEHQETHTY